MPKGDDAQDVKKAAAGDPKAWARLVDRYAPYVNAIVRSARVPEADQPDAFQYVFVELHKALPKLKSDNDISPWLRQTTIRHAVRLRQSATRENPLPDYDLPDPENLADDIAKNIANAERDRLVRLAVESLKDQCRRLVQMLFFEDSPRPYAQVAQDLGLSIGSIGQIRIRCLQALEKSLRQKGAL